jgi:hypothetical protein
MTSARLRLVAFMLAALALVGVAPVLGAQTDVIRGQITSVDGKPLAGARVKVSSYQGDVEKSATTDNNGRFTVVFINGEGDYWIDLTKIGFAPKRIEVRKVGEEAVMLANVRMSDVGATLGTMEVTGERTRALPTRNGTDLDVGGGDRALTATNVDPDQAGNLAAMAAAQAGFQIIPGLDGAADAFSALGLSGDQNNTTFDGLGSGVTALPPDILVTTSLRPYTFDVSLGGFSGAQTAIQTIPGTNISRRLVTTAGILPPLEWGNQNALAQGAKYTNVRLGGNAAGPIVPNQAFYNLAYNFQRNSSDLQTLLNTSPVGLTAAGVSPDSAQRFVNLLRGQGIPVDRAGLSGVRSRDAAQLSGNLDLIPSASGTGSSFTIGGAGNYQRSKPVGRGTLLLTTPAHAGETSFWGANATVVHSIYLWSAVLSKTTLGFAASGNSTSPYESIPEGTVRVNSLLTDGSASVKPLLFGGGSTESSLSNQSLQLSNQLSWYTTDNRHALKFMSSVTRDAFRNNVAPNLLGAFSYNSLADLQAESPASFVRTLSATTRAGSQLAGSASLGDSWRPTTGLQVQYGVRADANRFLSTPAFNQDILNTFGVSNRTVPNRVYFSPRIGTQWYYGDSPEVQYAPGSARPPRAVIHAGVGVFQNMVQSQLIGTAVSSTGLPDATQSISCVGAATPIPDWDAFLSNPNAIPTQCADGSAGSVFATASPNVMLFDPRFHQQRSVRGAADWSGPVLDNRFALGLQTIVSSGLDQQDQIDVNLNPTARFTLAAEGNRPVFVDPSAIVPTTGSVAIAGSRASSAYQHVWMEQSALKLDSKQLSINITPVTANAMLHWQATYTFLDARQTFNGFTSTAGNPFDVEWAPSLQAGRHQVTLQWSNFPIRDIVYLSTFVRLTSGQRYTPMIAGDVNGDGLLNDRAFIVGPGEASNPAGAAAMTALLANATPSARRCLRQQTNTLASYGSCQAPWTANGALAIRFNPQKIGLPKRTTVSLVVQNTLALADVVLHGGNGLRGWGENLPPDQSLLFVRGFDPLTRQFMYDVNQRFGSTRPQQSAGYALPYVSLNVSVDVGVPRERQGLSQRLDLGRGVEGTKLAAAALAAFGKTTIPNPMGFILQQSDSLHLTRLQADSLATLSRSFTTFADTVWAPVGRYLAALPNDYSSGEAYGRYVTARERTVDYLLTLVPHVKRLLTPAQRRKLPPQVANFLDERVLRFLRSSTM